MESVIPLVVPVYSTRKDVLDAADLLSVGRSKIKRLVATGELPTIKHGGRRVVAVADLQEYVNGLHREQSVEKSA